MIGAENTLGYTMRVEIQGISKRYGKKEILKNVSFSLEAGECAGLLGGNGCGKSTLLSVLAGIIKPDSGSFCYKGNDLFLNPRSRARLVGYIPQGNPLIEELSAWDNLLLYYSKERIRKELDGGRISMLGIESFLHVPVSKMSGGMKKRLSIAMSISEDPPILLLDEITAALDMVCKQTIAHYIESHKNRGGSVILVTHDITELNLCDSLYILKDGEVEPYTWDGDMDQLIRRFS